MATSAPRGYKLLRDGRYEHGDETCIKRGLEFLREALQMFMAAGAPKTAARIRLALSSAKGAARHLRNRRGRWEGQKQA